MTWPEPRELTLECHTRPDDVVWQMKGGVNNQFRMTASRAGCPAVDTKVVKQQTLTVETVSGRRTAIQITPLDPESQTEADRQKLNELEIAATSLVRFSERGIHLTLVTYWPTTENTGDNVRRILEGLRKVDRAEWEHLTAAPPG